MNDTTKLVRQAKEGNIHAFALLYEQIYQDMYRFAVYTLQNTQDAEDAVSETVIDAFRQIAALRDPDAFRSWMFRILTAKCNRQIRHYMEPVTALDEDLPDTHTDLDESIAVRGAFAQLKEEDRLLLALNLFAGYNSSEIGEILHLNANTVRSRQSRALQKMKEQLQRDH